MPEIRNADRCASAFCAGVLLLCIYVSVHATETLKLKYSSDAILAAFDKVLSDPYLERITGLKILFKDTYPGDNKTQSIAGTQQFDFVMNCTQETRQDNFGTNTVTVRTFNVTKELYLAFFPRLEVPLKNDNNGICKVRIKCELTSWKEKPVPRTFSDNLKTFAKDLANAALNDLNGFESIEYVNKATWSPFNPRGYPDWLEKCWLPYRLQLFLSGEEDLLAKGLTLCDQGNYGEALPVLEALAKRFPVDKSRDKALKNPYRTEMPEIHALLGDLYLRSIKDTAKAEPELMAAANPESAPFLAGISGRRIANRGYGVILAKRARKLLQTNTPAFEQAADEALLCLRAYLGWYGDKDAPDKAEITSLIREIDPERMEREKREQAKKEEENKKIQELKQQQGKVKDLMEF